MVKYLLLGLEFQMILIFLSLLNGHAVDLKQIDQLMIYVVHILKNENVERRI